MPGNLTNIYLVYECMVFSRAYMCISPRFSEMTPSAAIELSSLDVLSLLSFISMPRRSIFMRSIFSPAGRRHLVSTNLFILLRMSLGCVFHGKRAKRCDLVQTMLSRLSLNIS